MPRNTKQISVGTSPVKLNGGAPAGSSLVLRNLDASVKLYVGAADVTASTGFEVRGGEVFTESLAEPDLDLFGVVAAGTVTVSVMTLGR